MKAEPEPKLLPLDKIDEPAHQLRISFDPVKLRELADDMAMRGLLQRIRVHHADEPGRYRICAGHRRYLAACLIGWADIPADIAPACSDCTRDAAAENLQRADLTPLEEARFLDRLAHSTPDLGTLAHQVRRSEDWVTARLQLLGYPPELQEAIHERHLALNVASLLARIEHDGYRRHLLRDALDHGATARTVAVWLQHYEANRTLLESNMDTVEHIASQREQYRILAACDYCGEDDDLQNTRVWRLCATCHAGMLSARKQPA